MTKFQRAGGVSFALIEFYAHGWVWRVPHPQPGDFKQVSRDFSGRILVPLSRKLSRKLSRWFVIVFSGLGVLSRCPA